jgi:hypothetical protein
LGRALAAALTVCLLAVPAHALEKIGTTSMQVLKIAQGVRGIAMGNAMTATARDVEAVWSNPGALTEIKSQQALFSQINMPADVHLNSVAFARPWGDYSAFAFHAINLFTNDMKVRTWERPEGTGEYFNAWDLAVGAGFAHKLTDRFSLGANVRYLHSRLEDESYDGVAVDLGTLYKTGLRSMRVGMSIQNLGPDVKYSGTFLDYRNRIQNDNVLVEQKYEGASLPTVFRLGVAFDVYELLGIAKHPDYETQLSVEMNHPNDNRERLNVGVEGGYRHQLFLRLGGKFAYDEESIAGGFGVLIPVFDGYKVKFDYAYSYWGRLTEAVSKMDGADQLKGQPHRLAIGLEW